MISEPSRVPDPRSALGARRRRTVPIGGPKQRALLALLLFSANRVVSRERLIDELFAEQSVNSADHALRNHVSRLRKVLAPAAPTSRGWSRAPRLPASRRAGRARPGAVRALVADGREALAAGDAGAAADVVLVPRRLWQGGRSPTSSSSRSRGSRWSAWRSCGWRRSKSESTPSSRSVASWRSCLSSRRSSRSIPFRERFRAQLMLALYRSGRQAEGLEVYRRTRKLLIDELGLEPGVELQELERAILVQDPALSRASTAAVGCRRGDGCPFKGLAPFELADAELFFGRERLVDELVGASSTRPCSRSSGLGKRQVVASSRRPAPPSAIRAPAATPGRATAAKLREELEQIAPG